MTTVKFAGYSIWISLFNMYLSKVFACLFTSQRYMQCQKLRMVEIPIKIMTTSWKIDELQQYSKLGKLVNFTY